MGWAIGRTIGRTKESGKKNKGNTPRMLRLTKDSRMWGVNYTHNAMIKPAIGHTTLPADYQHAGRARPNGAKKSTSFAPVLAGLSGGQGAVERTRVMSGQQASYGEQRPVRIERGQADAALFAYNRHQPPASQQQQPHPLIDEFV
ncbi:MAG: hypothetical protein AAF541_02305 [Pseudomonadota bacterium]